MRIGLVTVHMVDGKRRVNANDVLAVAEQREPRAWGGPPLSNRIAKSERIESVKALYESGLTTYEIGERLGFCQATIANDIKKLGISRIAAPPRKYEAPEERECAKPGCSEKFMPPASAVQLGTGASAHAHVPRAPNRVGLEWPAPTTNASDRNTQPEPAR